VIAERIIAANQAATGSGCVDGKPMHGKPWPGRQAPPAELPAGQPTRGIQSEEG
jgi:hypothetical protein